MLLTPARWMWGKLMPRPEILTIIQKSQWMNDPEILQWKTSIRLKRGWLFWKNKKHNCRIFLIRRDFGDLTSPPEGIWLKWIEDGKQIEKLNTTLVGRRTYEVVLLVRDSREGVAYITNEEFVESGGSQKRWQLKPGRDFPLDPVGRFTFWIEVGVDNKRWRSQHYYAVRVPQAGVSNDEFVLETLYERMAA